MAAYAAHPRFFLEWQPGKAGEKSRIANIAIRDFSFLGIGLISKSHEKP